MHDDQELLEHYALSQPAPSLNGPDLDELMPYRNARVKTPDARRLIEIRRELADLDEHLNDLGL
ncbi:MAG: hypothetical protein ACPGUC_07385 [Gammaproteobacteria bacterium]